ncbi:LysM peptidoglycan-binding domain-containing protein [Endozoicomonas ascidiicola]|uniref:FimV/HubP-related protein n=1 Tax=Endozoicomonas ascidiicola TaxID=1698521 RepID=UPI000AA2B00C|nr:LysM peptidoglycan-binding domain-containing protein [Endozoicomonas ascidiicola]
MASPKLGNIVLNHAQDNHFNGVIAIDALPDELKNKKLKAKLGSITDFYRHDVGYSNQLSSLRFNVLKDAGGKHIIRVKSMRPIVSGTLPLVVKLYAGRQKIYGVYDLEMRPGYKGFAKNQIESSLLRVASSSAPIMQSKQDFSYRDGDSKATNFSITGKQLSQNTHYKKPSAASIKKVARSNYDVQKPVIATSIPRPVKSTAKHIDSSLSSNNTVLSGTSISKIAMELLPRYPEHKNWQSLMNHLVSLNPTAFIDGDKNRLRESAVLVLQEVQDDRSTPKKLVVRGGGSSEAKPRVNKQSIARVSSISALNALDEPIKPEGMRAFSDGRATVQSTASVKKPVVFNKSRIDGSSMDYRVAKSETLSEIAFKLSSQYSEYGHWKNLMAHLVALNPGAFINDDINRLKADIQLRLPSKEQRQKALAMSQHVLGISSDNHYKVRPGDSLSAIAIKLARKNGGSAVEIMRGIVKLNPNAFAGKDINRLMAGKVLTLPVNKKRMAQVRTESLPEQLGITKNRLPTHVPVVQTRVKSHAIKTQNTHHQVNYGESIGTIAMRLAKEHPELGNWKSLVNQLVAMNPKAFINGDPSQLLTGAELALPTIEIEAEVMELPGYTKKTPEPLNIEANREVKKILSAPVAKNTSRHGTYRVTDGDNLSLITYKLLDKYPHISSLRVMADELIRMNPSVLSERNQRSIPAGTLLLLPDPSEKVHDMDKVMHQLEINTDARAAPHTKYDKISKPLERGAVSEKDLVKEVFYVVPKDYTISMVAIQLHKDYPEYESWAELMNDLYDLNPEAFVDNDINQLRSNAELKLPIGAVSVY